MNVKILAFALSSTFAFGVFATDYYVGGANASDENDGSSSAPFATLDKAFDAGGGTAGNNIYLAADEYTTTKQYGYDLKANLIGCGQTRDDVVIRPASDNRTLRMNKDAAPTVTNITIIGRGDFKADKGGAIEMNGGTLVDCVVKNGTANNKGGNIYMSNSGTARVIGCLISGGVASQNGGNICFDGGQIVDSIIRDGTANGTGGDKGGGNIHISANDQWSGYGKGGLISRCQILNGGTGRCGGILSRNPAAIIEDCLIAGNQNGGVMLEGADMQLLNNTIANNAVFGITGYGSASSRCKIVNCAFYGNKNGDATAAYTGTLPSTGNMIYCAFDTDKLNSVAITAEGCLTSLSGADFVDVGNDDFTVATGSILIDAGTVDPRGTLASATDLARAPRLSGKKLDIGAYEFQKRDMTVRITETVLDRVYAPAVVTFTHEVNNSVSPENVEFTYDFGDESEPEKTKELSIVHAYEKPGTYVVTILANNVCEEESAEGESIVNVASSIIYVRPNNKKPVFPYDTPEKGLPKIKEAMELVQDGYEIILEKGVHEIFAGQVDVSKAITIRAADGTTPDEVILRNISEPTQSTHYYRVMQVDNTGAFVAGVTMENGKLINGYGGNLRLAAGVISNCVIRSGLVTVSGSGNAAGGGVEMAGSGVMTHCIVTNNTVVGSSGGAGYRGGAIFYPWKSAGKVYNSLIAYNTYQPTMENARGTAGLFFNGGNDDTVLENCTIVGNVVEGTIADASAALHCNSYTMTIRNNVFAYNYVSGTQTYSSVKTDDGHKGVMQNCVTDDETPFNATCKVAPRDKIFKDYAKGDLTPLPGGVLNNKGLDPTVVFGCDLAGNPRVFGKAIDIGCYECQRLPGLAILIK